LKEGDVFHNRPVSKAVIAEIAQVVAVAPHLLLQLRVPDRRAGHVLVHSMRVLLQLAWEVPEVAVHLQHALDQVLFSLNDKMLVSGPT
jgi:hypothetical protein